VTAPQIAGAPRWGLQTGFFQRRQPMFWLAVILLVYTGFKVLEDQLLMLENLPTAWSLSWVLMALYAVPVALIIYRLDLFEREPLSLILFALAWGGIVSVAFAGETNTAWFQILGKTLGPEITRPWGAALIGPPVEETLKVLGVVAIVLIARLEVDDVFDGFVYGAMVGLGFTIVEDVHYFINFVAQAGAGAGEIGPVLHGFFIRVIVSGLYGHVLYTGVAGMGVAYAATRLDQPASRRYGVALLAFAAAIAAHFFWNSPLLADVLLGGDPGPLQWFLYAAAKGLPFLIFVVALLRLAGRREHQTYAALVDAHPADDIVTAAEMQQLGSLLARRAARKRMTAERGRAAGELLGRLQREQVHFALTRSRTGSDDDPEVLVHVERIRDMRAQLAAMPLLAAATSVTATSPGTAVAAGTAASVAPAAPLPWSPTHRVPPGGMAAWDAPDPARPQAVTLDEGLDLVIDGLAGDWARVRAVNGWTGWVDARRLITTGAA
jgi:RsiW-degrading membrane proteinase PrsW (M82 family)